MQIETPVLVALIAALASLFLGLINLMNQKRLERLKKTLDFETIRFDRLHELKQGVQDLAEQNRHFAAVRIKQKRENLAGDELVNYLIDYQEKQAEGVSRARRVYLRNKHLLDIDLRTKLDDMLDVMSQNVNRSMDVKTGKEPDVDSLLFERFRFLEDFIPEFADILDVQLDKITSKLSGV